MAYCNWEMMLFHYETALCTAWCVCLLSWLKKLRTKTSLIQVLKLFQLKNMWNIFKLKQYLCHSFDCSYFFVNHKVLIGKHVDRISRWKECHICTVWNSKNLLVTMLINWMKVKFLFTKLEQNYGHHQQWLCIPSRQVHVIQKWKVAQVQICLHSKCNSPHDIKVCRPVTSQCYNLQASHLCVLHEHVTQEWKLEWSLPQHASVMFQGWDWL